MTCVLEVYDICQQTGTRSVTVHTNLGYIHYSADKDWRGLLWVLFWQLWPIVNSKVGRKRRYDSWLRDGPPECIKRDKEVAPKRRRQEETNDQNQR